MILNLSNKEEVQAKTNEEIQIMRIGGLIWQAIKEYLLKEVKVGMSLKEIEKLVEIQFEKYGVQPAFKETGKFPYLICTSLNNCVVHGSPTKEVIKEGDKLTIDLGFKYKEFNIDSAFSLFFHPSSDSEENKELEKKIKEYKYLDQLTKASFYEAINELKAELTTGFITEKIETFFKTYFPSKYSLLENFTGHGIGKKLHDYPRIQNFGLTKEQGVKLPAGATICIEPMIIEQENGKWEIGKDGYGVCAKNKNALTIHYEHLVLIQNNGVEILTASQWELEEMRSSWEIIKKFS
ncbi:type I methionyl aminopeptidase [Mycoplasma parvum]|uniref:Methionine aminopeptidase n=1 Tax=Mycoplasma parvum str. Indiana TaxID=1403316 RepID=U5NCC7_9MOLU|nr:type I methionyl aminopeptidase [Mycoplasma parvum]AGX89077.1 methionine aminopeptidase [Mycoplasma parvum str. Indiana]